MRDSEWDPAWRRAHPLPTSWGPLGATGPWPQWAGRLETRGAGLRIRVVRSAGSPRGPRCRRVWQPGSGRQWNRDIGCVPYRTSTTSDPTAGQHCRHLHQTATINKGVVVDGCFDITSTKKNNCRSLPAVPTQRSVGRPPHHLASLQNAEDWNQHGSDCSTERRTFAPVPQDAPLMQRPLCVGS